MAAKYEMLENMLRRGIRDGQYQVGEMLPTEAELAEHYRVSRQTVRRALEQLVVRGLIEKRQGSGSRVISAGEPMEEKRVAVILTYPREYIFPMLLHDVQDILSAEGYTAKVYSTQNKVSLEREALTGILAGDFCGVLAEGVKTALPNPNIDLYREIRQRGIPLVFIHGSYPALSDAACVDDSNFDGAYMLTRYLLGKGHSHIGGIFKSDDIQGHQRYLGFVTALVDAHLPVPDDAILWFSTEDKNAIIEKGDAARLRGFIKYGRSDTTAVIAYNDEIAYHYIRELSAMNIDVPGKVAVVSFDNSHYCRMCPVPITSLGHIGETSGERAARLLISAMRGGMPSSVRLEWTMNIRESG